MADDACTQYSARTFLRIIDPDSDHDGNVDINDLLNVIAHWQVYCGSSLNCHDDVTEDHVVGINDLLLVLQYWGPAN